MAVKTQRKRINDLITTWSIAIAALGGGGGGGFPPLTRITGDSPRRVSLKTKKAELRKALSVLKT